MKGKNLRSYANNFRRAATLGVLRTASFLAVAAGPCSLAQVAAPVTKAPAIVSLTSDVCAQVSTGDELTFDWNPGFEHPGIVTGMTKAFLIFARRGEEQRVLAGQGGIRLVAMVEEGRAGKRDSTIAALPNGFFRIRFKLGFQAEPGEYRLVSARGDARVVRDYQGEIPKMSNSPLRLPLCLTVAAAAAPDR